MRRAVFALLLLAAALIGCGGGSDDHDGQAGAQPVDCKARPDLCR